ncbi:MAG: CsgG/HfaB family protein [bacterium]|jgi:curli production assembly/transport component CsgG
MMMKRVETLRLMTAVLSISILAGCASVTRNLVETPAESGTTYESSIHKELTSLPEPAQPVYVSVYRFKDQTGQYKANPNATSFSTAVTQGGTSMLIKALEDSGWFIPVEREGLPDLMNERKIIRSTRVQVGDNTPLPPLLFGGIILEGGIISYDTNVVTGGFGARYFGLGGSAQARRDHVTIYLRAVSVQTGQILKSVSTSKSILSREVDFGVYRFVRVQRLLEAETGFSTNEPPSMCVLEAIERAVYDLIIEGLQDGLWELQNPEDIHHPSIQRYFSERGKPPMTFDKTGNLVSVNEIIQREKANTEKRGFTRKG